MSTWYRYEDVQYAAPLDEFERPMGEGALKVELRTFHVMRSTPKGVWLVPLIGSFICGDQPRFVLSAALKRYACPTEAEARESFRRRKQRQISILSAQLRRATRALQLVENERDSIAEFV